MSLLILIYRSQQTNEHEWSIKGEGRTLSRQSGYQVIQNSSFSPYQRSGLWSGSLPKVTRIENCIRNPRKPATPMDFRNFHLICIKVLLFKHSICTYDFMYICFHFLFRPTYVCPRFSLLSQLLWCAFYTSNKYACLYRHWHTTFVLVTTKSRLRFDRRSTPSCTAAQNKWKKALRETQTLRARWLYKVQTPPARPLQTHTQTDRTDYNTLRR